MALTRKMLAAMDIPAEKIDEIIDAHTETVSALKDERDKVQKEYDALKSQSVDIEAVKKERDDAKAELDKIKGGDWENKFNTLNSEFTNFKADVEAKATKAKKESAYKKLLSDAGISAKRIDSVMKVSGATIDGLKFDKDGNIEDSEKLVESAKTEWADFISTTHEQGADVSNPPTGDGKVKPKSIAAEMVAAYRNNHYGNPVKED